MKTLPEEITEKIIRGIMDNFPEASSGCALRCIGWDYPGMAFNFTDDESGKKYHIERRNLMEAFPLIFTHKWPNGCTQPPHGEDWETWEEWLCQADAIDFDAFAQLVCLGECIYG